MTDSQATQPSKGRTLAYWGTTGIIALIIGGGGVADIIGPDDVLEAFEHLGYPSYFAAMLGVWKVLGAITIVAPKLPRLKEWAYAGIVIDLIAAAVSHAAVGDGIEKIAVPAVLVAVAIASHQLRPASRVLGNLKQW